MASIVELWKTNRDFLSDKKLQQILSFTGEGKLKDENDTSQEFREYLHSIPNERLIAHARECLQESFQDSGLALQDVVNEMGFRLGFEIQSGVYRGRVNGIGFDGIWRGEDNHHLVVEVKTTDAYRINLDTLSEYRRALIDADRIPNDASSILIIVGRQDTGDLEAQIRGSRHAWDIRLISTDSLASLLALREKLNDPRTLHQIGEILKPTEYTRVDRLIDLMFTTAQDVELDGDAEEAADVINEDDSEAATDTVEKKFTPVAFHAEVADRIQTKLNTDLVRQSKSAYHSHEKSLAVNLAISKTHKAGANKKYWFAFHPHQREFLQRYEQSYVAFGCGSPRTVFMVPFNTFEPLLESLWTTEREDRTYWHVVIHERDGSHQLQVPQESDWFDIEPFRL